MRTILILIILSLLLVITGCHRKPPRNSHNICRIFKQYKTWYWDAQRTQKRWGVPISVTMAILHQESGFKANAKPPRKKLLWIIPWRRPSSAYGYSQAIKGTWDKYLKSTGRSSANRTAFSSAIDFVGWYVNYLHRTLGIAKNNTYALYLAYHEGSGNYRNKTYQRKPWLMSVARRVQSRANAYHAQLQRCRARLPKKPWWRLW